jgi:methylthioribose-1-phosphate isomerase
LKVAGKTYRTVWLDKGVVHFIDQNLLPFDFVIRKATGHQQSCIAIREMAVRGAGAIGALAGYAMAQAFLSAPKSNPASYLSTAKGEIESTRPTARNLFYAVEKVFHAGLISPEQAVKTANEIADKDAEDSRKIGEYGSELIRDGFGIQTHCNAGWLAFVDYGTALSPIYRAHEQGKSVFVYVDETRPRNQGARLTAWELGNAGIPFAIIPDNAGAHFMSKGKIHLVITGADRIAVNGDTANKIGTLEKAIVAREYNIPFYIAAPLSTFDPDCHTGADIPIEERPEEEVLFQRGMDDSGEERTVRVSAPGSQAMNPAFDVTPFSYLSGIITEKGIIRPSVETIKKVMNP